jgi:glycosyltransferase involved in cell wall biosynthesis
VAPPSERARPVSGRATVGTIGTISPRKGSDLFLAAARLIRDARDDVDFRMIGDHRFSRERAWAEALVAEARCTGITCGISADVYAELAGWDVFVLPSREDPFPFVVLEAMASGLPTVAARVGGIPEQLGHEAGVLVAPNDAGALAEAISRLLDDAPRRAALGAAAAARVRERFTLERQADGLDAAYRATAAVAS